MKRFFGSFYWTNDAFDVAFRTSLSTGVSSDYSSAYSYILLLLGFPLPFVADKVTWLMLTVCLTPCCRFMQMYNGSIHTMFYSSGWESEGGVLNSFRRAIVRRHC